MFTEIGRLVLGVIGVFAGLPGVHEGVLWIVTLIPSLALGARRLHDINRTGWWLLLWLVLVIGWIVLIVWAIKRGNECPNKYGPDRRRFTS